MKCEEGPCFFDDTLHEHKHKYTFTHIQQLMRKGVESAYLVLLVDDVAVPDHRLVIRDGDPVHKSTTLFSSE